VKIVIVGPTYPFKSGISHYTTLLFRELKKSGLTKLYGFKRQYPQFLFPGRNERDQTGTFPIREADAYHTLDPYNPLSWIQTAFKIRKEEPALVVFNWWTVYWAPLYLVMIFLLKYCFRLKLLAICHNIVDHEVRYLRRWLARMCLVHFDCFVVHSEFAEGELLKIKPRALVRKVPHPVYEVFDRGRYTENDAKRKLGLGQNVILFFGIVRPYKGLRVLLEAMPNVLSQVQASLVVVGEFWEKTETYRKAIRNVGIQDLVRLVDQFVPNEDVELYFRAADVLVLPYFEAAGSGIAQIACAFDLPIIATRVGVFSEMVHDGVDGFLVSPNDRRALAQKIIRYFLDHKKTEFSQQMKSIKPGSSWGQLAQTILDLAGKLEKD